MDRPNELQSTPRTATRLRRWNLLIGLAHAAQGAAILALSNDFSVPIVGGVPTGPPGTPVTLEKVFFDLNFPLVIAAFLFLAAIDHLLTAAPGVRGWYERKLDEGVNYARWTEYSVSASLMIVLIAVLTGINNLYALVAIFGVNASMILFGLLMERFNGADRKTDWYPYLFGCVAGIVPWLVITIALVTAGSEGDGVPGFVYGIYVSLFVFFNAFALNQWLQYRGVGRFSDYVFGERVYLVLSLGAKSALAWQVFSGTLAT